MIHFFEQNVYAKVSLVILQYFNRNIFGFLLICKHEHVLLKKQIIWNQISVTKKKHPIETQTWTYLVQVQKTIQVLSTKIDAKVSLVIVQ